MLFTFVKRMYSYAWCSVHGVKVARFSGMSEVSGYSTLLSACTCTVKRGALSMVLKVARFPGMSEVSGSIPVSGHCFLLIFVVFTLCLPCYSPSLSACTVERGDPSTASGLTHS